MATMCSVDDQCATEAYPAKMKSEAAILNCQIENDVMLCYFKLAWTTARTAIECVYAHRLGLILSVMLVLFLYVIYKSYWSPPLIVKELGDVGFSHISKGASRDIKIARALKARQVGVKVPPPYPNGWFALAESKDLKIGGVTSIDALGQNFAVYRGEDGVARCVDAYCPHLGANLGVGGTVEGGCIECPFHKWKFDAEGTCVSIPGQDSPPKGISIKTWPTVEVEGAVWVWFDAEGRSPLWDLQDGEDEKSWGYRGRCEFVMGSHVMDLPENGSDAVHFDVLHSPSVLASLGDKYPCLRHFVDQHFWAVEWTKADHIATLKLDHHFNIGGLTIFRMNVISEQIGPGLTRIHVNTAFGPVLISQTLTPIGVLQQKVVHRIFTPWYNAPLGAITVLGECDMFSRDVVIWNSKKYLSSPAYGRTDKTIRAFRAWYMQFYSENSVSFKDATQNRLDW